jgi:hypothetical protein
MPGINFVIPSTLPGYVALQSEDVFIINDKRAQHQDIHTLHTAILNLRPTKMILNGAESKNPTNPSSNGNIRAGLSVTIAVDAYQARSLAGETRRKVWALDDGSGCFRN